MITYLAETTLPFGSRLAHQKYELICFYREGTINKNNLPVINWETQLYNGNRRLFPWQSLCRGCVDT